MELAKRFRSLKKEYIARQREKSVAVLAANQAALEQFVSYRLAQAEAEAGAGHSRSLPVPRMGDPSTDAPRSFSPLLGPPGSRPPGVTPLPLSERRASAKLVLAAGAGGGGGQMRMLVRSVPAVQPPPNYTSWAYLKRNELARDHGRRMFLVDEEGETVPADDGETEERLPWEEADGAAVDWAMTRLAQEAGWDNPDVLEALMEALRPQPQPEAVAQRLTHLFGLQLGEEDRRDMEVEEALDVFEGSFCRRCRVYGCRTHSGGHVRPNRRPAQPPPDTCPDPCGPHCWKRARAAAAAGGRPTAAAAPAAATAAATAAAGEDPMDVDGSAGARDGGVSRGGGGPGAAAAAAAAAAGDAGPGPSCAGAGGEAGPSGAGGGGDGGGGGGRASGLAGWSVYDLSVVRMGIEMFGAGNPCLVSSLVGPVRTCAQVKAAIDWCLRGRGGRRQHGGAAAAARRDGGDADGGAAAEGADGAAAAAGPSGGGGLARVPARRKGGRGKKTYLTSRPERSVVVGLRSQHGPHDMWREYQPCACAGSCRPDCPCVRSHNFCEKFCACSLACRERFRGCNCRSGCKNNQCPCVAAGRECDPDLCGGCAPTLERAAEPGRECHNMRLRMRQHAHVVLGTSDIPGAGWGVFAAQHVGKNGFLGEYTGDLITQDEANRRGSVYDHMNNSYLFNLNKEWVVDAKFRGNKLRCANHSGEPVAAAKVLLVDGESRIAIFADKPIAPGTEITYNYRYSDDTAPHWVKKKQSRGQAHG